MQITLVLDIKNANTKRPPIKYFREQVRDKVHEAIEAMDILIDKDNGEDFPIWVVVAEMK